MGDVHSLRIYEDSLQLVKEIYDLIRTSKNLNNDYSLCDQIKRAAVSVASNISEGYYRTQKLTKNYLSIASLDNKILINFQNKDNCDGVNGFWDTKTNEIVPLESNQESQTLTKGE
jgi:hypothetical protein